MIIRKKQYILTFLILSLTNMRILLLFLAVITIFWLVKRLFLNSPKSTSSNTNSESLVECDTCKTHIPQSDAIEKDGKYFCCNEHVNKQ